MNDHTDRSAVDALESREPGADPTDPYEDVDVAELPDWWRRAIEEFEAHGLRAYRPPRFEDDVLKRTVIERLERDLGVTIQLTCFEPESGEPWRILVDWEPVGSVGRRRSVDGYSVFEMESDRFEELVRSAVDSMSAG